MASKKKRQDDNQKSKTDAMMASMFPGLVGGSNAGVAPMDLAGASDADLEAELAALMAQDNSLPAQKPTATAPPIVRTAQPTSSVNDERAAAMAALPGLDLDAIQRLLDEDPTQLSDVPSTEDESLLAELDTLHGSDAGSSPKKSAPFPSPSPQHIAPSTANSSSPSRSTPAAPAAPASSISPLVQELDTRVEAYTARVKMAQERGDQMKAGRYERQLKTLQQALKEARGGKPVDTTSLPPAIPLVGAGGNSTPSSGMQSKDESPTHAVAPSASAAPLDSIASAAPAVLPKPKLLNAASAGLTPVEETEPAAGVASPSSPASASSSAPAPPARAPSTFDAKGYASRGQKLVLNYVSGATGEALERALEEKFAQLPADRRALLENLGERREQFVEAARQAQAANEAPNARKCMATVKQFESVMEAVFAGRAVDLSLMPAPPPGFSAPAPLPVLISTPTPTPAPSTMPPKPSQTQSAAKSADPDAPPVDPEVASALAGIQNNLDLSQLSKEQQKGLFKVGGEGNTPEEALQVRADKLREQLAKAKETNDSSKVRRYTRLVQQYDDAIKAVRAGRTYEWGTLFDPPGFDPIAQVIVRLRSAPPAVAPRAVPGGAAATIPASIPRASLTPAGTSAGLVGAAGAGAGAAVAPAAASAKASPQVNQLLVRQLQFKKAALQAKQSGNMAKAKEYLRCAKCMDPMLEAARSGLPVDLASLPTLIAGGVSYAAGQQAPAEVVDADRVQAIVARGREATFVEVNSELKKQNELCKAKIAESKAVGDVASTKRFEELLRTTVENQKSLAMAFKSGDPAPEFHFEARSSKVQKCNVDLSDSDLEITVVRAINLRLPNDLKDPNALKTCARVELTLRSEEPFSAKSESATSVNPEYNFSKRVAIQRTGVSFARAIKSKSVRVEVLERRGLLFKSEEPLGAVHLKLERLDRECELHEALDLMDVKSGKRPVGGRVELRVRIRAPLLPQHSAEIRRETVLVIDRWARVRQSPSIPALAAATPLQRAQPLPAAVPSSASMHQLGAASSSVAAGGRMAAPSGSPRMGSAQSRQAPPIPGAMMRPQGAMNAAVASGRVASPAANTSPNPPAMLHAQQQIHPPPLIPRARPPPQ